MAASNTTLRLRIGLAVAILLGVATTVTAGPEPLLLERPEAYTLGRYVELLEDRTMTMSIRDAVDSVERFRPSDSQEPNLGFTRSAYWARFSIANKTDTTGWIIENAYAPIDRIELYEVSGEAVVESMVSGDQVAQEDRSIRGATALFPVTIPTGETRTYYLRFETEGTMAMPLRIWTKDGFVERHATQQMIIGIYFGLMFIMAVYNLVIFFSVRELSYLYYVLFVVTHGIFQACLLGVASVYLWPQGGAWTNYSLVFFASLGLAFSALFTREFLHTKRMVPKLSIVIDLCLLLSLVNAIASPFIPYSVGIRVTNASLVAFSLIYIAVALVIYARGYKPARYYLIAWAALFVAAVTLALKNYGVLPSNIVTNSILQIGSIIEIVLLSLALTDRINILRQEKTAAERRLLESQEEALKATEAKLYFDNLTGLPNRNRLLLDIRSFARPHLFLINVDGFKQVNDYYGNKVGDQVLLELKSRIESFRPGLKTRLYKLHADEYALIIDAEISIERCHELGEALHDYCQDRPYPVNETSVRLDVSIGISNEAGVLLEQADMALTEARRAHTSVRMYDETMQTKQEYEDNLKWVTVIRDALADDAIVPYFQPIVNNATRRIEKHECLIRIRDRENRIVSPGSFLRIAKASKLYPELSRRMIAKSFELLEWNPLKFTLNVSIDDIVSSETLDVIRKCLDKYRRSDSVVFEILESEGIHRYDLASSFIEEMKERGCSIAIDDFGSGYSNFEHILRLKVDFLKLNSSLIRNLDTDDQARAIVAPIVDFSRGLGIRTIAEFVHCESVFREVEAMGIDFSQGHFFGAAEPAPADSGAPNTGKT